jgi:hypothetical protein
VVPDGVVDLHAEVLLGLLVEVVERQRTLFRDGQRVEDVISALDGEVSPDAARFFEGHVRSLCRVQLRLDVGVGQEEKGERLRLRRSQ